MKKVLIVAAILVYLFLAVPALAESDVHLNEFLIEPTNAQQVELFNRGDSPIDIAGWYIDDSGGTTYFTIPSSTVLYPHSCLVFSSSFNLNSASADTLRLFDNTATPTAAGANLLESFSYSGSPGANVAYAKKPDADGGWITQSPTFGKSNETGDSCTYVASTPTPTQTATPTLSPTPTTSPTHLTFDNLYISEVNANPTSGETEWVELYNGNDFIVTLTDWSIDDIDGGGSSPKVFSLTLDPGTYGVVDLSSSMFNNDGDEVRLLDADQNLKDSIQYTSSVKEKTIGRTQFPSFSVCFQENSKGKVNTSCVSTAVTSSSTTSSAKSTKSTSSGTSKSSVLGTSTSASKKTPKKTALSQKTNTLSKQKQAVTLPNSFTTQDNATDSPQLTHSQTSSLVKGLSFASFSYAILSVGSLLLKIKKGLG